MSKSFPSIALLSEYDTHQLAVRLANTARSGDVFLLEGDIGTGKSTFARAFLHHLVGPEVDVPSPTFTLVQSYDFPQGIIHHYDLYRIEDPSELEEIGLYDHMYNAISLIEWPDRMKKHSLPRSLTLTFAMHDASHRSATITPQGAWEGFS